jgi:hypothetical protein
VETVLTKWNMYGYSPSEVKQVVLQSYRGEARGATVLARLRTCGYSPGEQEQVGLQS